jgi:hypothetical protein
MALGQTEQRLGNLFHLFIIFNDVGVLAFHHFSGDGGLPL